MAKPKKLDPSEYTKADLIRNVLRANIEMTRTEAGAFYGDENLFSSSQFSTVRSEIERELEADKKQGKLFDEDGKPATKPKAKSNGAKDEKANATAVAQLQHENAYLRWQLAGERYGFFERWLEEQDG